MQKLLPRRKDTASVTEDRQYFTSVEALLFTFHQLANKVSPHTHLWPHSILDWRIRSSSRPSFLPVRSHCRCAASNS